MQAAEIAQQGATDLGILTMAARTGPKAGSLGKLQSPAASQGKQARVYQLLDVVVADGRAEGSDYSRRCVELVCLTCVPLRESSGTRESLKWQKLTVCSILWNQMCQELHLVSRGLDRPCASPVTYSSDCTTVATVAQPKEYGGWLV